MIENLDTKGALSHYLSEGWLTYLGVLAISIWGGITRFLEQKEEFSWRRLCASLSSASFAGMMTALGCDYAGVSGPLMGVLCGVAAHMGTPAIINLAMRLKIVRDVLGEPEKKTT